MTRVHLTKKNFQQILGSITRYQKIRDRSPVRYKYINLFIGDTLRYNLTMPLVRGAGDCTHRALGMLDRHSTTKPYPNPIKYNLFIYFQYNLKIQIKSPFHPFKVGFIPTFLLLLFCLTFFPPIKKIRKGLQQKLR